MPQLRSVSVILGACTVSGFLTTSLYSPAGFRTDVEISASDALAEGQGRSLQKWSDDDGLTGGIEEVAPLPNSSSKAGEAWDQFAANESRFGLKSNYDEDIYTTKLDRTGQDFKTKEKEAERIAAEIMGQATTNTHLAEERGLADDSGQNEEDK